MPVIENIEAARNQMINGQKFENVANDVLKDFRFTGEGKIYRNTMCFSKLWQWILDYFCNDTVNKSTKVFNRAFSEYLANKNDILQRRPLTAELVARLNTQRASITFLQRYFQAKGNPFIESLRRNAEFVRCTAEFQQEPVIQLPNPIPNNNVPNPIPNNNAQQDPVQPRRPAGPLAQQINQLIAENAGNPQIVERLGQIQRANEQEQGFLIFELMADQPAIIPQLMRLEGAPEDPQVVEQMAAHPQILRRVAGIGRAAPEQQQQLIMQLLDEDPESVTLALQLMGIQIDPQLKAAIPQIMPHLVRIIRANPDEQQGLNQQMIQDHPEMLPQLVQLMGVFGLPISPMLAQMAANPQMFQRLLQIQMANPDQQQQLVQQLLIEHPEMREQLRQLEEANPQHQPANNNAQPEIRVQQPAGNVQAPAALPRANPVPPPADQPQGPRAGNPAPNRAVQMWNELGNGVNRLRDRAGAFFGRRDQAAVAPGAANQQQPAALPRANPVQAPNAQQVGMELMRQNPQMMQQIIQMAMAGGNPEQIGAQMQQQMIANPEMMRPLLLQMVAAGVAAERAGQPADPREAQVVQQLVDQMLANPQMLRQAMMQGRMPGALPAPGLPVHGGIGDRMNQDPHAIPIRRELNDEERAAINALIDRANEAAGRHINAAEMADVVRRARQVREEAGRDLNAAELAAAVGAQAPAPGAPGQQLAVNVNAGGQPNPAQAAQQFQQIIAANPNILQQMLLAARPGVAPAPRPPGQPNVLQPAPVGVPAANLALRNLARERQQRQAGPRPAAQAPNPVAGPRVDGNGNIVR